MQKSLTHTPSHNSLKSLLPSLFSLACLSQPYSWKGGLAQKQDGNRAASVASETQVALVVAPERSQRLLVIVTEVKCQHSIVEQGAAKRDCQQGCGYKTPLRWAPASSPRLPPIFLLLLFCCFSPFSSHLPLFSHTPLSHLKT